MPRKKNPFKTLRTGDPIEILWKDAVTISRWTSLEECANLGLARILTRGTFIGLDEEKGEIKVALDAGLMQDGSVGDYHGIGIVAVGDVIEVHKLRRSGGRT